MNRKKINNRFKSNSSFTSKRMKRVKSSDTKLEKAMEELLIEIGVPFVKQPELYGHPDFQLSEGHILIFCDSSFWHGRNPDDLSGKNFKTNKELWIDKLTKTKQRDKRINRELKSQGHKVLRFWDDEILRSPETCKKRLLKEIRNAQ
jgi:DNA mismatch endonuclease Vsr